MDLDLGEVASIFREEAAEGLAAAEQALVALESRPDDAEAVASVFRIVHTIKGNALSLGYGAVADVAHALEDALQRVRDGDAAVTPDLVGLLLRGIDALEEAVPEAIAGRDGPRPAHLEVVDELRRRTKDGKEPSAAGASAPASAPRSRPHENTLRVDLRKLDRLLDLAGEIAIARGRLRQALAAREVEAALEAEGDAAQLFADLQELIMTARLVPLGSVFRQQARTVRDLAAAQGRLARLAVAGEDVEVDTSIIEHIRAPLTHLIRNAIDHGIEPPEVRRGRGKDPCGTLTLSARREAGSVVVELSDDGAGLDRDRILARARTRGLLGPGVEPSDVELARFLFEPGFSTADRVSHLSGRGVGLDVVRRNVESIRGAVSLADRPGAGLTVSLRLPFTLAIIPGLKVEAAGETLVVPLDSVVECLDRGPAGSGSGEETETFELRGRCLPGLRLSRLFAQGCVEGREQVVVVRQGRHLVGLIVDRVLGESPTVIKPLGPFFRAQRFFSGGTILGNGRIAPVLDVPVLVQHVVAGRGRLEGPPPKQGGQP